MRQKVGTSISRPLLMRARLFALRQGKPLNEVIEEALEQYLAKAEARGGKSVVEATRGVLPASPEVVRGILEEDSLLDT